MTDRRTSLKDWDLDLTHGELGEQFVKALLTGGITVEVKTDRYSHITGKFAIEYACRGQPSGIAATKADWWALVSWDGVGPVCVLMVPTTRLRVLAREQYKLSGSVAGGDDTQSDFVLVPLIKLLPSRKRG